MERQKDIAKATVPVLRAMGRLDRMEGIMEKALKAKKKEDITSHDKFLYKALVESQKDLNESILMLNYNFTETTRKRKFDVCQEMGEQFRPYGFSEDTGEYLFGLETQKAMKSELKKVQVKAKDYKKSKNFRAPGKSHRSQSGGFRGNNRNYSGYPNPNGGYNNNNNYNNYNNQNNNNQNNNNRNNNPRPRGGPRSRGGPRR